MIIPRVFHIIWIGPKKFPYTEYKASWLKYNPNWVLRFWTDNNIPKLINQDIYDRMETYAGKADVLRLELLYKFGGVYTDADSECLKPLEPLIKNYSAFGMTGNTGGIANGTLGFTPNYEQLEFLIRKLPANIAEVRRRPRYNIYDLAGTNYITPILRKDPNFIQIDLGTKRHKGRELICRYDECTDNTYIRHYNKKSWK